MTVLAAAARALIHDPVLSEEVTWDPGGGADMETVRAVVKAPDQIDDFRGAPIHSETVILSVLVADLPNPVAGQLFTVRGEARAVQGVPRRGATGLIWEIDTQPASAP